MMRRPPRSYKVGPDAENSLRVNQLFPGPRDALLPLKPFSSLLFLSDDCRIECPREKFHNTMVVRQALTVPQFGIYPGLPGLPYVGVEMSLRGRVLIAYYEPVAFQPSQCSVKTASMCFSLKLEPAPEMVSAYRSLLVHDIEHFPFQLGQYLVFLGQFQVVIYDRVEDGPEVL